MQKYFTIPGILTILFFNSCNSISGTTDFIMEKPSAEVSSDAIIVPFESLNKIYSGEYHTCAVTTFGNVKCWGRNDFGQLGYNDKNNRGTHSGSMAGLTHLNLGVERTAKQLALGWYHSCAILDNDKVKCWGRNDLGQLGYNDTVTRGDDVGEMDTLSYVDLGPGRTAKQIKANGYQTCAILDNDQLKCWGNNSFGQLGYDDIVPRGNVAGSMASLGYVNLGLGRTAKQIISGSFHTCVLLDNNQVKCFGRNLWGMLGYGDTSSRGNVAGSMALLDYVDLGAGRSVRQISGGAGHTCAILDNNQLKCWGSNSFGQLGYDDTSPRGTTAGSMASLGYVNLGLGRSAKQVIAGSVHTCVIMDNNQIRCWGNNMFGQLGYDDHVNRGGSAGSLGSLVDINIGINRSVLQISEGGVHTCIVLDILQIKCWGLNDHGQLGYDDLISRGGLTRSVASDGANLYNP